MDTPPDSSLADMAKRIVWRLMAMGHNRAELLMVEIQEERERARMLFLLASGMTVLALLAGMTITALIALAAGTHFIIALIILAVVYSGGALLLYFKLAQMRQNWETLSGTRDQLEKDRKCLEKTLT